MRPGGTIGVCAAVVGLDQDVAHLVIGIGFGREPCHGGSDEPVEGRIIGECLGPAIQGVCAGVEVADGIITIGERLDGVAGADAGEAACCCIKGIRGCQAIAEPLLCHLAQGIAGVRSPVDTPV